MFLLASEQIKISFTMPKLDSRAMVSLSSFFAGILLKWILLEDFFDIKKNILKSQGNKKHGGPNK